MKPKNRFLRSSFLPTHIALSLGFAIAGLSSHAAQAANEAWSTTAPGPANGNFSGTNWTVGTTGVATPTNSAATGDALYFDASAITTLTNDLTGATFAGFTFNAGSSAYTIGGNSFTLSGALTNNGSNLQTFSNAITLAATQTITGTGSFSLGGNLNGAGTSLTKSGTGNLSLGGGGSISGNLTVNNGTVSITGGTFSTAAFSFIGRTASQSGVVSVSSGATLNFNNANGGGFGYASASSGVIYNAGTFSATQFYMSDTANNGSYGYIRNAGTMTIGNTLAIARGNNASLLDIVGGTTTLTPTADGTLGLGSGTGSTAGLNISSGGTFTLGAAKQVWVNQGGGAYTSVNISGSGSKLVNPSGGGFDLGKTSNSGNMTTLTLSNGGELDTQYMFTGGVLSNAILNFNGGTLKATAADGNGLTINTGAQGSLKTYIYSGGATVDTNGFGTSASPVKMGSAILTPTGNGVASITLGGTATGYVGAPIVKITGGGGEGAAAIANFDPTTGTVTSITVTSPGSGYTSAPTVTLVGGNGGSTGAGAGTATATATIAAVTGGGLTKIGAGTLTLTAANTYTGGSTINAGTLTYGVANALADSGAINVNGGTFNLASFSDTVGAVTLTSGTITGTTGVLTGSSYGVQSGAISGILGGTSGLAKSTAGTVTVSGMQAYTGATTVNGGNLTLSDSGSINSSSGITINGSGAKFVQTSSTAVTPNITLTQGTLDGTTTVGAVSVGAGGIVANGNGLSNKLTVGSLAFSGGAVNLNLLGGVSNTMEGLDVTGDIQTPGTPNSITVNVSSVSPLNLDTPYSLIFYGSYSSGSVSDFVFGGNSSRKTGTFANDTTNQIITLTVSGDTPKWTGADNGNWVVGTTGGNKNWQLVTAGTPTDYIEGDDVSFTDTASLKNVNISAANVSPASTTFNNSTGNDYTVSSSGGYGIAGTGPLVKSGTGKVTITSTNSFTGVTTINEGTLQIGDGTTDGSIASSIGIVDNGALSYNLVGTQAYANVISGTGSLSKSGVGTLTLSGTNTYSGATTINNGTLSISTNDNLGSTAVGEAPVTLNGGRLTTTAQLTNTHEFTIGASGGTITVLNPQYFFNTTNTLLGSGALTLTGNGSLVANSGDLRLAQTNTYNGNIILQNGGILEYGVVGAVDSTAPFTINNQGELSVNSGVTLPNAVNVAGGTNSVLSFENGNTGVFSGSITLNANLTVGLRDWYNYGTVRSGTVSGVISGSGFGISTTTGTGTGGVLTLSNTNTYTGATVIAAGSSIQLGSGGAAGSISASSAITNNGTLIINRNNAVSQGTDFSGAVLSGTGAFTQAGTGTTTLNVNNTYTGTTTVTAGELDLTGAGTTYMGNLAVNGGLLQISAGTVNVASTSTGTTANTHLINGGNVTVSGGATLNISGAGAWFPIGDTNGQTSTLTLSGGTVNVTNQFGAVVGRLGGGVLTINSGTFTNNDTAPIGLVVGDQTTGVGTVNLNGGSLVVNKILSNSANANKFYFNGGSLSPIANNAAWYANAVNLSSEVRNGGAIINTAGFNVTIGDALVHSAVGGDNATDGGLTKSGAGTLTLTGTNTYTGTTAVNAGTLALGATGSIANSSGVTIAAGTTLDVTAATPFAMSASQTVTFKVDGTGSGSSGLLNAAALDITNAHVAFTVVNPLDDNAYVLASYTSLTGTAFASVTPPTGYTINYTYNSGTQIALVKAAGYTSWATSKGLTTGVNDGTTQDPNHNGITNLMEYMLNGDPLNGESPASILPSQSISSTNLVFDFHRLHDSASDTTQVFQYGSDLTGWTDVAIPASGTVGIVAVTSDTPSAGVDHVVVTVPKGANTKLFGRLHVTKP